MPVSGNLNVWRLDVLAALSLSVWRTLTDSHSPLTLNWVARFGQRPGDRAQASRPGLAPRPRTACEMKNWAPLSMPGRARMGVSRMSS